MEQISFTTQEEIINYCSNPSLVVYCSLPSRPGLRAWMVELEYTRFKPDTEANHGFHLMFTKWPDKNPLPFPIVIVAIDQSCREYAEGLLWKHGLRAMPQGMAMAVIDSDGKHEFFLQGSNVFTLENHSGHNVVYTNDMRKMQAANELEKQQCQRFFDEHARWLASPDGKAEADAFWAKNLAGRIR